MTVGIYPTMKVLVSRQVPKKIVQLNEETVKLKEAPSETYRAR